MSAILLLNCLFIGWGVMDSEGSYPYFLQNAKMKVINTCNCFSILYPNISMRRWVADGNKIGDGYCLKGSETVKVIYRPWKKIVSLGELNYISQLFRITLARHSVRRTPEKIKQSSPMENISNLEICYHPWLCFLKKFFWI